MALAMAGRAEGQGLPVRAAIGARATVLPLPSAQVVLVDSTRTAAPLTMRMEPADSNALTGVRRRRRVVVSYPGT